MSFINLAQKRQSCRKYLSDPIPKDVLERCLEAARLAPSACNAQPWRFVVVNNDTTRQQLAKKAFSGIYALSAFAGKAPVLVALVRDSQSYIAKLGGFFRKLEFSLIDIGIVGEHFILQAAEEGLGTCWIGWFNENGVREVLGLSKKEKIDILISVGYPEKEEIKLKVRKSREKMSEFR